MKQVFILFVSLALVALSSMSNPARADEEADKLQAHGKALGYTVKTASPPSSIDTGGAAILVNAPIDVVRKVVTNYNNYQKFLKPFDQSRVLSKRKGVSEVYLQVPILHGAARIWAVTEMSAPRKDGAGEIITSRFKRGNISDFRAVWRLRAVDATTTIIKLELLVDPKLPFASSLITTHLVKSAEKGVKGVKEQAQIAYAKVAKRTGLANNQSSPKTAPDDKQSSDNQAAKENTADNPQNAPQNEDRGAKNEAAAKF